MHCAANQRMVYCLTRRMVRPMRTILLAFAAVSLLMAWPDRARQDDEIFKTRSIKIGATEYQYRVFLPNGWSKKKKWPLILFFHGAGVRGSDNIAQTKFGIGPASLRQKYTVRFVVC